MADEKKYVFTIKDIPPVPLTDKVNTRFLLGDNVLLSFIEQPPGATFPIHSHDCEQILIILEGTEDHIVDGQTIHMKAGDVCVHPANVPHGGQTKTGFKGIDIFSPPRQDYVERIKQYQQK